jgi:hypothetical protein
MAYWGRFMSVAGLKCHTGEICASSRVNVTYWGRFMLVTGLQWHIEVDLCQ